jgi:hypothetical protein
MCDIIQFPSREVDTDDILDFPGSVPATSDPFPSFRLSQSEPGGMVSVESRVPVALAEAMLAMVKSLPHSYSCDICDREEGAALIDASVPMAVALDLLAMRRAA